MFLKKKIKKPALFLSLLIYENSLAVEDTKNKNINNQVYNEKTHAGPMGMGLTKSYEVNNQKICIYNTIYGQEQITLKNKNKCPLNLPKKKIKE